MRTHAHARPHRPTSRVLHSRVRARLGGLGRRLLAAIPPAARRRAGDAPSSSSCSAAGRGRALRLGRGPGVSRMRAASRRRGAGRPTQVRPASSLPNPPLSDCVCCPSLHAGRQRREEGQRRRGERGRTEHIHAEIRSRPWAGSMHTLGGKAATSGTAQGDTCRRPPPPRRCSRRR